MQFVSLCHLSKVLSHLTGKHNNQIIGSGVVAFWEVTICAGVWLKH